MKDKILIIDDEADIVSMLKDYFEFNSYDTITAVNGLEAIEKAEKQPDIILLDINMPDIDGVEVCMRMRDFVLLVKEIKKTVLSITFVVFIIALLVMAISQNVLNFSDKRRGKFGDYEKIKTHITSLANCKSKFAA